MFDDKIYKLNPDQLLISEFAKDALDYYDELIWLLHSQNPERHEYSDNEMFRKRLSDKYSRITADYKTLLEKDLIDKINSNDIEEKVNEYIELNKELYKSFVNNSL